MSLRTEIRAARIQCEVIGVPSLKIEYYGHVVLVERDRTVNQICNSFYRSLPTTMNAAGERLS